MRLIDADNFKKLIRDYMSDYKHSPTRLAVCKAFLSMLGDKNQTPTIDPETLPIVQELRDQLAKVTAERDSLKIFYNDVVNCPDCNTCKNQKDCEYVPKAGEITIFNCPLWKGLQEEVQSENRD